MKLTIYCQGTEHMRDMVAHVNSEQLQKIMTVIMDEELDRATELRNEAQAPKHSGLDREQSMYECGNCGVPRFVHNGILEACPNCGDDETELSLYDDVP